MKIKEAKEILLDPAKRKAYDAEYDNVIRAIRRLVAKEQAARGVDKKARIISNLRLDQPTALEDGSPLRDHCVVQILDLPPQVTVVDLVRAVAEIRPVGRVMNAKLMRPSRNLVGRTALVEFPNDERAQHLGLLALRNHFYVLGKTIWHCRLMRLDHAGAAASVAPPPEATRVLLIDGPKGHRLMTTSALGELFDREVDGMSTKHDSCQVRDGTKGPDWVRIEWAFTTWRAGAWYAMEALRRDYPELTVTYGEDPCE